MRGIFHYRWAHAAALGAMAVGLAASRFAVHRQLVVAVHQGIEGDALKKAIERYKGHGHSFQVVELPYEALRKAVADSVRNKGHLSFDVIMVDDPWLPEIHRYLAPFSADAVPDDFVESCRRVSRSPFERDKFSAVPFVGNSQLLCYRISEHPEKPRKPPQTWEDLVKSSANVEPGRFGYVMRVKAGNSILTDFLPILWAASPNSLSGEPPLKLHDEAIKAFKQIRDLGKDRRFATASQDDFDLAAYVLRDRTSMSIIWSAWAMQVGNLKGTAAETLKKFTFRQVPGTPVLGAWLLAVPLNSRHPEDAGRFIRFATSHDELVNAARNGNPPPRRSVFANEELKARYGSLFPEQLKSLENAKERPRTERWREIEERVGACLADLNAGLIEAEPSFKRSRKAVEALNGSTAAANQGCRVD